MKPVNARDREQAEMAVPVRKKNIGGLLIG